MKAIIKVNLKAPSVGKGQHLLFDVCNEMKQKGVIDDYSFEIETDGGYVTDRCVLSEERVIA